MTPCCGAGASVGAGNIQTLSAPEKPVPARPQPSVPSKHTRQQGDPALCDGVHQALTGYLGDKLHLVGAGLTVDDVTRHLQARQLDPALIEQVTTLLHLCDSARYAPGSLAVAQLTEPSLRTLKRSCSAWRGAVACEYTHRLHARMARRSRYGPAPLHVRTPSLMPSNSCS